MTITAPAAAAAGAPVSSTQSNIDAGQKNLTSASTNFLTLLTTQLQHQDPTSPLDTNAFTQQLVSMTGVQQQLLSNQLLQQLVGNSQGGQGVTGAVGMIGKTATATSSNATLSGGQATWNYSLASSAAGGSVSIVDSFGKPVWSGTPPSLSAGAHSFTWDGRDSSGRQLPDGGVYTLNVAASDSTGGTVASTISVQGQVTGVSQVNGQTLVSIGPSKVPLSQVTAVSGT